MAAAIYRIRFHGRGGQGIKTASRILGSAFFAEGFEVQDAPRYGAERRGAPIFAYVRAARGRIDERGVIRAPDLVLVADDTLIPLPAAGVLVGVGARSVLLIASRETPATWRERLNLAGPLLVLPDLAESADRAAQPLVGVACAGAAARLTGVIGSAALAQAVAAEVAPLGARAVAQSQARALAAFDALADQAGLVVPGEPADARDWAAPAWVELPVEEAGISAPIIHAGLTSELANTGAWRTLRPVVDYERCNRCWWVCSTFCPDGAIAVDPDGAPRIDYDHCKGCLVCVAQCPPHAIAAVPEHAPPGVAAGGRS